MSIVCPEIAIDLKTVSLHRKGRGKTLEIYLNASSKPVSAVNDTTEFPTKCMRSLTAFLLLAAQCLNN